MATQPKLRMERQKEATIEYRTKATGAVIINAAAIGDKGDSA